MTIRQALQVLARKYLTHPTQSEELSVPDDAQKRRALIELVRARSGDCAGPGASLVLVSLEQFFEGNHSTASIGCNLRDHPGPRFFFETLKSIRARPGVREVLVAAYESDDNVEEAEEMWPFSDTIVVLAHASVEEVRAWAAPLQPDAVQVDSADDLAAQVANPPTLQEGAPIFSIWWD